MPVAMTQRLPAETDTYDAVTARLDVENDPPPGMIVHTAGITDGEMVIFDVWESEADFERFRDERLTPAFEAVIPEGERQGMPEPERRMYELHNLVRG